MQKWEYLFVTFRWENGLWRLTDRMGSLTKRIEHGENEFSAFQILGEEGWELVYYSPRTDKTAPGNAIFKRPV